MPAEHDNNSHSLVFGTKKCFVGHCKLIEWRNTRSAGGGAGGRESSGTWRRHWGERESTGPCKETGHGANPQHGGCHAHFVQVSRPPLPLDAAAPLGKANFYRRHTREGKEASNRFNSKHTTVEWTETL